MAVAGANNCFTVCPTGTMANCMPPGFCMPGGVGGIGGNMGSMLGLMGCCDVDATGLDAIWEPKGDVTTAAATQLDTLNSMFSGREPGLNRTLSQFRPGGLMQVYSIRQAYLNKRGSAGDCQWFTRLVIALDSPCADARGFIVAVMRGETLLPAFDKIKDEDAYVNQLSAHTAKLVADKNAGLLRLAEVAATGVAGAVPYMAQTPANICSPLTVLVCGTLKQAVGIALLTLEFSAPVCVSAAQDIVILTDRMCRGGVGRGGSGKQSRLLDRIVLAQDNQGGAMKANCEVKVKVTLTEGVQQAFCNTDIVSGLTRGALPSGSAAGKRSVRLKVGKRRKTTRKTRR